MAIAREGKLPVYGLEGNMILWCDDYLNGDIFKIYDLVKKDKALHGVINIEKIEDCFLLEENGAVVCPKNECGKELIRRTNEKMDRKVRRHKETDGLIFEKQHQRKGKIRVSGWMILIGGAGRMYPIISCENGSKTYCYKVT